MTTRSIEIEIPRLHANQANIYKHPARFKVLACGRRFGKTVVGLRDALENVTRGYPIWWTAITYQNVNDSWQWLKQRLTLIPGADKNEVLKEIRLPNGGYLGVRSLKEYDNLRGQGLYRAYIDEAAFTSPMAYQSVIEPMLLDYGKEAGAWFMSSPNGRNWFYDMYRLGLDDTQPDYASFQYTCYDNPRIDHDELARIKRNTPERTWREEYLAEFLDDGGSVFRKVRENATIRPQSRVYDDSHVYVMGVDWARDNDYTVIAVIDVTTSEMVDIDRFNQINWNLQRSRIEAMAARWRPDSILAEHNSIGSPNIEALQDKGLPVRSFKTTAKSKPILIDNLAAALENNELSLLDDEYLVNELMAYTMERLPGGSYQYNAPAGQHDDTVIATALAWKAASGMAWVTEFT